MMSRSYYLAKQLVSGLIFALISMVAHADSSLWSLVWLSHDQAKSLSYSGLLITESANHSQTSKLLHQAKGGAEFEVLERLGNQSAKWIRHNDQIQCIIPDQKMILTFPRVLASGNNTNSLEAFYSISELSGQRVAGRSVRVLRLTPKDDLRYEYRLYLDRENKLLMRSELYSLQGEVLEHVGFKEITFDPTLIENPSLVKPGPGWISNSTEIRLLTSQELPYDLPDAAFGFRKANTVCRVKGTDELIHQTVYSDGLSTVSLFIQKHIASQSMQQVPISRGAVMSKSETQGQHMVTVLGEVPEKTLGLFLKSVRWKSQ
jgi:sigma-E factor negative regulatory protein RseB